MNAAPRSGNQRRNLAGTPLGRRLPLVLLLAIARMPFVRRRWWEEYYPHVCFGLGLFVCALYNLFLDFRRMTETWSTTSVSSSLIGSLFVAAGGIFLHTERHATPWMNTLLLAIGALVVNVWAQPGLRAPHPAFPANETSQCARDAMSFFSSSSSAIWGSPTPIGDPPLFLGYLNGVPFQWTVLQVWHIWLPAIGAGPGRVFLVGLLRSPRNWRHGERPGPRRTAGFELRGIAQLLLSFHHLWQPSSPATPVREIIMVAAAAAAYRFRQKDALRANEFTFTPIKEVAILFAGIFATMVPALDWLGAERGPHRHRPRGRYLLGPGLLSFPRQRPHLSQLPQCGDGTASSRTRAIPST